LSSSRRRPNDRLAQLLTRLVDQRAQSLLQNVGGRGPVGEREMK